MAAQRRVKGIAIARPIVFGNTATFIPPSERVVPDHSHRWTIAVRSAASPPPGKRGEVQQVGGYDDISYFIKKVSFKLHETYPNALRNIEKPPFEVTETGWGEFEVQIRIYFVSETGEKPVILHHLLKLHPWTINQETGLATGAPDTAPPADNGLGMDVSSVHSWQFDEIVFTDPVEPLYNLMIANPPTPLPKSPRTGHHSTPALVSVHNGGVSGEFAIDTEEKEGQRIDAAKNSVLTELEEYRAKLIEIESQVKQIKQEIEGS